MWLHYRIVCGSAVASSCATRYTVVFFISLHCHNDKPIAKVSGESGASAIDVGIEEGGPSKSCGRGNSTVDRMVATRATIITRTASTA